MENYYAHVNDQGKVYGVSLSPSIIVPIPTYNSNYMNTFYDEKTGQFIGIKVILFADKEEIVADGKDEAIITASFNNWDGTPADYYKDLVVSINGTFAVMKREDGAHKLKFSSTEPGIKKITVMITEDPHLMEASSLNVRFISNNINPDQ
ncbi:hypothetical protein AV654_12375 [Paenibacillus elgii]|uniref:Uncharacterized protein n=1 Tax=Paenibacillus elgii TaxID=189691 RepID=A0A163YTR9_9BACL|nr:hypothetical protein [Paenibacillus elgii]KZE80303.1 hypothetical protein AV654_12375 [Paenibacillus elgii]